MKKNIFRVLVLLTFIMSLFVESMYALGPGEADNEYGNADVFEITFKKIEVSGDNINWTEICSGTFTTDICNLSVGNTISSGLANSTYNPGVYSYFRVTISRNFRIQGTSASGHKTSHATTNVGGTGIVGVVDPSFANPAATAELQVPVGVYSFASGTAIVTEANIVFTGTFATPYEVTDDGGSFNVLFGTQNAIEFDPEIFGAVFWPVPPEVTITYSSN